LARVRRTFEESRSADPMYAALSRKALEGNRWDSDEFFANGRSEIDDVLAHVDRPGISLKRGHALDVGCATGG
jgi:hypothetical protein